MMSSHPESFFKYYSADTAKIVLKKKTIRWSSPRLYNDPFDCHFSMSPKFSYEELKEPLKKGLFDIITAETLPDFDYSNPFARQIELLYRYLKIFPTESPEKLCSETVDATAPDFFEAIKSADEAWKQEYDDLRILCVCESVENLLLWSHYAKEHKGVAFELACMPEIDNVFSIAKRVNYSEFAPSVATVDEFVKVGLGLAAFPDGSTIWTDLVYTKSKVWEQENEWRVVSTRRPYDTMGYEDTPFDPREIRKIYLGCRISDEDRTQLIELCDGDFQHVEVYQSKQSRTHFKLEFERIR